MNEKSSKGLHAQAKVLWDWADRITDLIMDMDAAGVLTPERAEVMWAQVRELQAEAAEIDKAAYIVWDYENMFTCQQIAAGVN